MRVPDVMFLVVRDTYTMIICIYIKVDFSNPIERSTDWKKENIHTFTQSLNIDVKNRPM